MDLDDEHPIDRSTEGGKQNLGVISDAKTTQMLRLHYTRTSLEYCQNERGEAVQVTGTNRLEIGWIRTTDLKTDLFKSADRNGCDH